MQHQNDLVGYRQPLQALEIVRQDRRFVARPDYKAYSRRPWRWKHDELDPIENSGHDGMPDHVASGKLDYSNIGRILQPGYYVVQRRRSIRQV